MPIPTYFCRIIVGIKTPIPTYFCRIIVGINMPIPTYFCRIIVGIYMSIPTYFCRIIGIWSPLIQKVACKSKQIIPNQWRGIKKEINNFSDANK